MQKLPAAKFSVATPKDLPPEPCYFLTIPCATHTVYIVYESDEIFHGVILLGKLRVTWNLSQCACMYAIVYWRYDGMLREKRKRNSIHV